MSSRYYRARITGMALRKTPNMGHITITGFLAKAPVYAAFVADTIDALQNGRAPIAGIHDNLAALRIVDKIIKAGGIQE